MIVTANSHTHTNFCDGQNTPEEMAKAAYKLGFTAIGFSGHSPAPFDPSCPGISDEIVYRNSIAHLKEEYAGKMGIMCGVEQDYYAPVERGKYDYILGSLHYLKSDSGELIAVDNNTESLALLRDTVYNGSAINMVKAFYASSVDNVKTYQPNIVGHYDLIVKLNTGNIFFDEKSSAYKNAALESLDATIDIVKPYGGMIELNTAAVIGGRREEFYPAPFLLRHMAQRKVRVIINSDCHNKELLNFGFEQAINMLKEAGYREVAMQHENEFADFKI